MTKDATRLRRGGWWITALLSGGMLMLLEMVAVRVYAPYFGSSIYVWGSMICVVMVALAIGYGLGGWLADRGEGDGWLYGMILAGGIYEGFILLFLHPVLLHLSQGDVFRGALMATALIFGPPMIAWAGVVPHLVRLLAVEKRVGRTAGMVSGVATLGGISGILVALFACIPAWGTNQTLQVSSGVSIGVGVLGLAGRRPKAWLGVVALILLGFSSEPAWSKTALFARESLYNLVRVVRHGDRLVLLLNQHHSLHTLRNQSSAWTSFYYDDFALGPLLIPATNLLTLGMGGGGDLRAVRISAPDIKIDAVEIDPEVVRVAIEYFGVDPKDDRLRIHLADARTWLRSCEKTYDLVHVDVYQGGAHIPFHLMTREFFQLVKSHLSDEGLLVLNLFDWSSDQRLLQAGIATLQSVFPTLFRLSREGGNHLLFAFTGQKKTDAFHPVWARRVEDPKLWSVAERAVKAMVRCPPLDPGMILTDDRAPIEPMIRSMFTHCDRTKNHNSEGCFQ